MSNGLKANLSNKKPKAKSIAIIEKDKYLIILCLNNGKL